MSKIMAHALQEILNDQDFHQYREKEGHEIRFYKITENRKGENPFFFLYDVKTDSFLDLDKKPMSGGFSRNLERSYCRVMAVMPLLSKAQMMDGTIIELVNDDE